MNDSAHFAKLLSLLQRAMELLNQQQALLQKIFPVAQEMRDCFYKERKPSLQEVARWTEVEQTVLPALLAITQSFDALQRELAGVSLYRYDS